MVCRAQYEHRLRSIDNVPPETPENRLVLFLNDNNRIAVLHILKLMDYSSNMYLIDKVRDTRLILAARYANGYFAKNNPHRIDAIQETAARVLRAYKAVKVAAGSLDISQSWMSSIGSIPDADELAFGRVDDFPAFSAAEAAVAAGQGTVVQADLTGDLPPTSPFTPSHAKDTPYASPSNAHAGDTVIPISSPVSDPSGSQARRGTQDEEDDVPLRKLKCMSGPRIPPSQPPLGQRRQSKTADVGVKKKQKLLGGSKGSSAGHSGRDPPVKFVIPVTLPVKRPRRDQSADLQRNTTTGSTAGATAGGTSTPNMPPVITAGSDVLARYNSVFAELQEYADRTKSLVAEARRTAKEKAAREHELSVVIEEVGAERAKLAVARKERVKQEKQLASAQNRRVQAENLARKSVELGKVVEAKNRLRNKRARELDVAIDLRQKAVKDLDAASEAQRKRAEELDAANEERSRRGVELDAENELRASREKELEARNETYERNCANYRACVMRTRPRFRRCERSSSSWDSLSRRRRRRAINCKERMQKPRKNFNCYRCERRRKKAAVNVSG